MPQPPAHTTGSLAALLGARLRGPDSLPIERLDTIDRAGPGVLTFIRSSEYAAQWARSAAAAALVSESVAIEHADDARALLIVPDADLALIKLLELFAPPSEAPVPGVHPSAVVDKSANIDPTATVGPCCVIGKGAVIEAGATLVSNVAIGNSARVGRGTVLHPGVHIGDRCRIGAQCILHANASIGADGFGYRPAPDGKGVVKIPHIGHVEIGDMVEIGANSCVDRAKLGATVVGSGTKIDNLVQVAHNCRIGRACLLCGQVGIAGSSELGDGVVLAGGVAVADNLKIGSGSTVGARSSVMTDIPPGETWLGEPAMPARQGAANYAAWRSLAELARTVRKLEKKLAETESGDAGRA